MPVAKFPKPLKAGDTIGIIAPARWPKREWLTKTRQFLEKRGYKTVIHPQCFMKDGQLAGNDAARVAGVMDMVADPAIDALLCARGGANSIRIIDQLDYKLIKDRAKPFIGFSDITVLLNAITQRSGLVTYHGPLAWNFAHPHDPRMEDDLFGLLENKAPHFQRKYSGIDTIVPGVAEGVLVGGNLTRLELLMGTPYDWSAKDSILFIEEVDEVIYKIDEKLRHLRLAGRFDKVRAVVVGEMVDIGDGETGFARKKETRFGRTLKEVLLENLPRDVPLCLNFPCGHGKYLTTLPVGARARLELTKNKAGLIFKRS